MSLLAAKNYDPATLVTKSCGSMTAMTAFDTTNLRLTFAAPASGNVLVRLRCNSNGADVSPGLLLGVMEGSTVRARAVPSGTGDWYAYGASFAALESTFTVTGLTGGTAYTWDAAYAVKSTTSNYLGYGGPATVAFSMGAFLFEVWEA